MALSPKLYYYSGSWRDITEYIVSPGISEIMYRIDNRVQGEAILLNVTLDIECPYYGSNKYKLELGGSDYWLLGAPGDGIKTDYINRQINLVLVDYLFYLLTGQAPLSISGSGAADSISGEGITVATIKDILAGYTTDQGSIEIENFSSRDGTNFYDGLGNIIAITKSGVRYRTKGKIKGKNQSADVGECFVDIRDVINDLITAEGFTLDVDFGYEESSGYASASPGLSKIWDCKIINGYLIELGSQASEFVVTSRNLSTGALVEHLFYSSKDWNESANGGTDTIVYQLFPDYRNNCFYIPCWYCSSYATSGTNNYQFRVIKISVASNGDLTEEYIDDYTSGFVTIGMLASDRVDYRGRDERWVDSHGTKFSFYRMTWYTDENLASLGKYRIILKGTVSGTSLYVIDPDLHEASAANSSYTYTVPGYTAWTIPDWINGAVVLVYNNGSNWAKRFYRVNQETLTAGYSVSGSGGKIHADDEPSGEVAVGVWRESIIYPSTIPSTSSNMYYFVPQVPNGHLGLEGVYNNYTLEKSDYMGNHYSHDTSNHCAGSAWDDSIDRALIWHTDTDNSPSNLYWDVHDHYTYKRMHLYQPAVYIDRKQQFIDAFVSAGFFYEQKNGNIRLFRIRGAGSNIGTITDADLLNLREIDEFSRFADEYSIRVLTKRIAKESGTVSQEITTLINDYGFFSELNAKFYSDWTEYLKLGQVGKEFILDTKQFYSITSTYMPNLGDLVTYDSANYMIIQNTIDLINRRIAIQCIAV